VDLFVTVDVEGRTREDGMVVYDPVDRFDDHLASLPCRASLFVTPDVVEHRTETVAGWLEAGHAVGLHVHPTRLTGGSDWLDEYDCGAIQEMLGQGVSVFDDHLGHRPTAFRAGRWAYSDRLLDALDAMEFEVDSSLRPTEPTTPYRRGSVTEYPLTVYANPIVRALLTPFDIDAVGLHADAFLRTGPRAVLFRALTRWLAKSQRDYLMVAYHDYDVVGDKLERRISEYVAWLHNRASPTTLGRY
jgi:peptidoglycan/xylan/chitin deacetylase (PgdA/CDA1 family)